MKLFQVLQEVAAARHILIMCHSIEIDGYAFCSGLDKLNLVPEDPDMRNRIYSATYLIKDAVLRPKYTIGRPDRFSLQILPLGELVDMYHSREATDCRDKVYALLGMSTDILIGLSPDYDMSWKDVFQQLVKSLISEQASVETWNDEQAAVIKSKACVLGTVSSTGDNRKTVDIDILQNISGSPTGWSRGWTARASAKPITGGDIVCLLEGASQPTIIRPREDYCAIIAIAVTLTPPKRLETAISWSDVLRRITVFPRDLVLVWDWETSPGMVEGPGGFDCFLNCRISKDSKLKATNATDLLSRLLNIGLLFRDSARYEDAIKKLRQVIEGYKSIFGKDHPNTLAIMDTVASVYNANGGQKNREEAEKVLVVADLLGRRRGYAEITGAGIVRVARSFDEEVMTILLNERGDEVTITEWVVQAAAGNTGSGREIMELLLDRRGGQVDITEGVVQAAAGNTGSGREIMELLLDRRGGEVTITKGVVQAAAGNKQEIIELIHHYQSATPLMSAVDSGNLDKIKKLVDAGANLNVKDLDGRGLLSLAAERTKNPAIFHYLLGLGLDPYQYDKGGYMPLHYMILNPGMTAYVLNADFDFWRMGDVPKGLFSVIVGLSRDGADFVLRRLLRRMPRETLKWMINDYPMRYVSCLCTAVIRNDMDALHTLVRFGADVNKEGCEEGSPLMVACAKGHFEAVKALVRYGARIAYTTNQSSNTSSVVLLRNALSFRSFGHICFWLLVGRYTSLKIDKVADSGKNIGPAERMWAGVWQARYVLQGTFHEATRSPCEGREAYLKMMREVRQRLKGRVVPIEGLERWVDERIVMGRERWPVERM